MGLPAQNISLLLLSGIPASGKTSCVKLIKELSQTCHTISYNENQTKERIRTIHVCYDDIIPDNLSGEETSRWKSCRSEVVKWLDQLLDLMTVQKVPLGDCIEKLRLTDSNTTHGEEGAVREKLMNLLSSVLLSEKKRGDGEGCNLSNSVFILDDNFFYRSMRYQFYQLARKYSVGFGEVCVVCSLQSALARNKERTNPVAEETIARIQSKFEVPDSNKALWEKYHLTINAEGDYDHQALCEIWRLICQTLSDPVPPLVEEDLEQKEASRLTITSSTVHQADKILRKCISAKLQQIKETTQPSSAELKNLASDLNTHRTSLLEDIKKGRISLPPLNSETVPEDSIFSDKVRSHFLRVSSPQT